VNGISSGKEKTVFLIAEMFISKMSVSIFDMNQSLVNVFAMVSSFGSDDEDPPPSVMGHTGVSVARRIRILAAAIVAKK
jgi:hypothetical protein